jgi:pimeloyl-ACP methyl ester carboxylesterase
VRFVESASIAASGNHLPQPSSSQPLRNTKTNTARPTLSVFCFTVCLSSPCTIKFGITATMSLQRQTFQHNSLTFSYLDSCPSAASDSHVLVALHGYLMEAATFAPLAAFLSPAWRVIALDQRGHGHSSHAPTYQRSDYIGDLEALFAHLNLPRAVFLGSSLGGVNAFQFAARHPERVHALIIEDIGAVVTDDISFILPWSGVSPTREDLIAKVGERFAPYLADSFRQTQEGWTLAFEPREMVASQNFLCGDHWKDFLATTCPALLIRGTQSRVTTPEHVEQMASRRPNTTLVTLEGGHILHMDQPALFHAAVSQFVDSLPAAAD